jgi:hypothetical protein
LLGYHFVPTLVCTPTANYAYRRPVNFERKLTEGELKTNYASPSSDGQPGGTTVPNGPGPDILMPTGTLDQPSESHIPPSIPNALPVDDISFEDGLVGVFGPGLDIFSWDFDTNTTMLDSCADSMPPREVIDAL